jgi:hypothetical protein
MNLNEFLSQFIIEILWSTAPNEDRITLNSFSLSMNVFRVRGDRVVQLERSYKIDPELQTINDFLRRSTTTDAAFEFRNQYIVQLLGTLVEDFGITTWTPDFPSDEFTRDLCTFLDGSNIVRSQDIRRE